MRSAKRVENTTGQELEAEFVQTSGRGLGLPELGAVSPEVWTAESGGKPGFSSEPDPPGITRFGFVASGERCDAEFGQSVSGAPASDCGPFVSPPPPFLTSRETPLAGAQCAPNVALPEHPGQALRCHSDRTKARRWQQPPPTFLSPRLYLAARAVRLRSSASPRLSRGKGKRLPGDRTYWRRAGDKSTTALLVRHVPSLPVSQSPLTAPPRPPARPPTQPAVVCSSTRKTGGRGVSHLLAARHGLSAALGQLHGEAHNAWQAHSAYRSGDGFEEVRERVLRQLLLNAHHGPLPLPRAWRRWQRRARNEADLRCFCWLRGARAVSSNS